VPDPWWSDSHREFAEATMYRARLILLAVLAGLTAEAAAPDAGKIDRLVT
jgi:hypothetical protein